MSDDDSPMSDSANLADISGGAGDSSVCDTFMDTDSGNKSVITPKLRHEKKVIIPQPSIRDIMGEKDLEGDTDITFQVSSNILQDRH